MKELKKHRGTGGIGQNEIKESAASSSSERNHRREKARKIMQGRGRGQKLKTRNNAKRKGSKRETCHNSKTESREVSSWSHTQTQHRESSEAKENHRADKPKENSQILEQRGIQTALEGSGPTKMTSTKTSEHERRDCVKNNRHVVNTEHPSPELPKLSRDP